MNEYVVSVASEISCRDVPHVVESVMRLVCVVRKAMLAPLPKLAHTLLKPDPNVNGLI
jgi:hypothetical protein